MTSCEKCWSDAARMERNGFGDQVEIYHRFLKTKNCTPEEQAGIDATLCPECKRKTVHQICGICMVSSCNYRKSD